ncbi:MAG TPA: DUF4416 family protein [bacterium]|nr:DUF4416 family protein [bacterium]
MIPESPEPVKLIIGILYSDAGRLRGAFEMMEEVFGSVDSVSDIFPFRVSDYYKPEMGARIYRRFASFGELVHPGSLASIKIKTNHIEEELALEGKRKVNLDPGVMDFDKFVLASCKYNGQKIYLDQGVWADLTLRYRKGHFEPYPWSFPDFKRGDYENVFLSIRESFKKQRKEAVIPSNGKRKKP